VLRNDPFHMPLLSHAGYAQAREAYSYVDADVTFDVVQTGTLPHTGTFREVFPRIVPSTHPTGVNLRKFEETCETVFPMSPLRRLTLERPQTAAKISNPLLVQSSTGKWRRSVAGHP